MQYNIREYNSDKHEMFKALTVKQPYANDLITAAYRDIDGFDYGLKTIEVRSKKTEYRGDIIICSSVTPQFPNMLSGAILGRVELYDVKPISEFTEEDWQNTRIPHDRRALITKGYGWLMRNPRKLIEHPVRGQLGIWNLVFSKDLLIEYPTKVVIDKAAWKQIQKKQK